MARIDQKRNATVRMANWYTRRSYGRDTEIAGVMAHSPPNLRGYGMLEWFHERSHSVDEKLKALAATKAATLIGCQFCLDIGSHLILPTLTLTLVLLGEYMLIMRSSVLDVFGEDYILTARAKGLSTYRIIRHHALRNAMLPMVTLIALNLGFTVSGAIQVEAVYSWPGLGALTVSAVADRDYPVLQGAFLLIALSVVVANLVAELIYGWLDPRVSEG